LTLQLPAQLENQGKPEDARENCPDPAIHTNAGDERRRIEPQRSSLAKTPAGPLLMAGYQQLPRLQRLPTLDKMKSRFAVRTSLQRRTTRQRKDGVMAGQALGKTVRW
jgi:hypothetical protein